MTKRIPETRCLECGHKFTGIGDRKDEPDARGPLPGDPVACIRCGAVMTVDESGALRGFTPGEMDALEADAETMNELARVIRDIHLLKHSLS